jgi:DNA gyrase subunit A
LVYSLQPPLIISYDFFTSSIFFCTNDGFISVSILFKAESKLTEESLFDETQVENFFNQLEVLQKPFLKEVVTRRTSFELHKAKKKAHLLEGLTIALNNIDAVIALIKKASSAQEAKVELETNYSLSEEQSQAILDMKLQKLTGLEQEKIKEEYKEILNIIAKLESILADTEKIKEIIKEELLEIKEQYGDERKTTISDVEDDEIEDEDLIPREDQVITITKSGYAKRLPMDTYRVQNRGGKGIIGTGMKEEDLVEHLFIANTHSYLLIFTTKGKAYWLKIYKIPENSRQSKGKALVNLVNLEKDEQVAAVIPVKEFNKEENLLMATRKGIIKKTSLEAYSRPRQTGIIGITLDEGDSVISVIKTDGTENILLASKFGQAVRFNERDARPIGRTSRGVRGITLAPGDEVNDMIKVHNDQTVLTVTENGYGKRTPVTDYRLINRGGKGVRNIICSGRNGLVAGVKAIYGTEDILLISEQGIIIRTTSAQIGVIGRNTQGVRIMKLSAEDKVRSLAKLDSMEVSEE